MRRNWKAGRKPTHAEHANSSQKKTSHSCLRPCCEAAVLTTTIPTFNAFSQTAISQVRISTLSALVASPTYWDTFIFFKLGLCRETVSSKCLTCCGKLSEQQALWGQTQNELMRLLNNFSLKGFTDSCKRL